MRYMTCLHTMEKVVVTYLLTMYPFFSMLSSFIQLIAVIERKARKASK